MRFVTLTIFLMACSDSPTRPDAATTVDSKLIDSAPPPDARMPDAAPPPPPMNITTACMHACDAIGVCLMEPVDPDCYSECAVDLADCTTAQVQTIDDCRTEACGADLATGPLIMCISAVPCVQM